MEAATAPPAQDAQDRLFAVGGKQPTTASITLTGGAIEKPELLKDKPVEKGQVVKFTGYAKVLDVGFKDTEDSKTGQVVGCDKRHKGRILELHVEGVAPDYPPSAGE
jgi:hypothetical protein